MEKKISFAVVKRLPRYYRYLSELHEEGVRRISSQELSEKMNVTASQIRQDFNNFGGFGQQGYGYNVAVLKEEIAKLLGLDKTYRVIIIGAGNLGQALVNYSGFAKRGFCIDAMFDIDEKKIGASVGKVQIRKMSELAQYVKENQVDIAALTLPKSVARDVAKELTKLGVRAFWNFAATDLDLPEDVVVENVHLAESLMSLSYNIANLPRD